VRDRAMLHVLAMLPQLAAQDKALPAQLTMLPFVPTASGALRPPSQLYDPR
jgi:hypothetical protein